MKRRLAVYLCSATVWLLLFFLTVWGAKVYGWHPMTVTSGIILLVSGVGVWGAMRHPPE